MTDCVYIVWWDNGYDAAAMSDTETVEECWLRDQVYVPLSVDIEVAGNAYFEGFIDYMDTWGEYR